MKKTSVVVALAAASGTAHAAATLELIPGALGTAISADGTVIVGNTAAAYETFRWTEETGLEPLGMATLPVLGVAAGTPDVSADGTRISGTILGADSTYATQGVWTAESGWQEAMPPAPPDGGLLDFSYGSSWGLSDDGGTLVGLYWRPGQPGGLAHASRWSPTDGTTDLGSVGSDSRANECDADGDVIVGWASDPTGVWQPTVWVDGVLTTLEATLGFCEATVVTPDGSTVFGTTYDPSNNRLLAAAWDRNGSGWSKRVLGALPGTPDFTGNVVPNDCTPDGQIVVGFNQFSFGNSTGFIWTPSTGMIDVEGLAAELDIAFPPGFDVNGLTAVSDDGNIFVGTGQFPPFDSHTFVIRRGAAAVGAPGIASAPSGQVQVRAWPNPTRGTTTCSLTLPRSVNGTLDVHDVSGRLVRRLAVGPHPGGQRELTWDGRDTDGANVPSGVYYLRLDAGEARDVRKLVVIR
jgi:uncharacterized membrane protein